jgi:thymidylate synthase (FAD)
MNVELLSITQNAERLIENVGRTAYLSFGQRKEGSEVAFIKMLIKRGHFSVLEHASATFRITGGSRAFTHQLVRHRLCSYTQQSQRYLDESSFHQIEPDAIGSNKEAHQLFVGFIEYSKDVYSRLHRLGVRNEDARFVLPNAVESQIVITANFREWRHIIELRGSLEAQWEIRKMATEVLRLLKNHAPTVFGDLEINDGKGIIEKKEIQ